MFGASAVSSGTSRASRSWRSCHDNDNIGLPVTLVPGRKSSQRGLSSPLSLKPGESLVSSVSVESIGDRTADTFACDFTARRGFFFAMIKAPKRQAKPPLLCFAVY